MKAIKKINNNVALCLDSAGTELVAFGKGIGFPSMPYEIQDLSAIEHTYYNVTPEQQSLFLTVPMEIFEIANQIVSEGKIKIDGQLNPNLELVLADHLSFAIERARKGMHVKMPSAAELSVKYPVEVEIGKHAVKQLEEKMNVGLGKDEAVSIALHFIDAEMSANVSAVTALNTDAITEHILAMIEEYFTITIDRDGFNCARFETHLSYLYGRIEEHTSIQSENEQIYSSVMKEYPKAYDCAIKIKEYFLTVLNYPLADEEILYLMLHINRLCTRETH